MKTTELSLVLILGLTWTAAALVKRGLSPEKKPPYDENTWLLRMIPQLSEQIKSEIVTKLANDTAEQEAVKGANITILSYRKQLADGINYYIDAKIGNQLYKLRMQQPIHELPVLQEVSGPLSNPSKPPSLHSKDN